MLPGRGSLPKGPWQHHLRPRGAPYTDGRYHRHCRAMARRPQRGLRTGWGRRRYKVSGRTKQDVIEALKKKSEELDAGLNTSRSYTVESAAHDWLEYGLPGRSERTRELYRDALAPLLAKIGKRPPSGPHRRGDRGKSEVAHRNPVQPVPADRS